MLKPLLAVLALSFPTRAQAQEAPIEIADGYVFAAGPTAQSGAAYMQITNAGASEDRLIGVASDAAARVELHGHAHEDGVMKMRAVEGGIALPPEETVALAKGGLHVMLMGLAKPLAAGDEVTLTLSFARSGEVEVTLPVDLTR